jgi:hypothetical protein
VDEVDVVSLTFADDNRHFRGVEVPVKKKLAISLLSKTG